MDSIFTGGIMGEARTQLFNLLNAFICTTALCVACNFQPTTLARWQGFTFLSWWKYDPNFLQPAPLQSLMMSNARRYDTTFPSLIPMTFSPRPTHLSGYKCLSKKPNRPNLAHNPKNQCKYHTFERWLGCGTRLVEWGMEERGRMGVADGVWGEKLMHF